MTFLCDARTLLGVPVNALRDFGGVFCLTLQNPDEERNQAV